MQRSEDFQAKNTGPEQIRIFTGTAGIRAFTKAVRKTKTLKLVVVMNVVNWWKCSWRRGLACDFYNRCRVDIRAELRKKEAAPADEVIHSASMHI
jgi:hypothetical protein